MTTAHLAGRNVVIIGGERMLKPFLEQTEDRFQAAFMRAIVFAVALLIQSALSKLSCGDKPNCS